MVAQFILQLVYTVLIEEASTAYALSLGGTIFDLLCSFYQYAYHNCKGIPVGDASISNLKLVEEFFIEM